MFDIIGRRRWFYAFSLLITIPGLLFILLTPLTNGAVGLKFSIDYTGGTEWEIQFQDPTVTTARIQAVLVTQGLGDSQVTSTSGGFFDIRTKPIGLAVVAPTPTPVITLASPFASAWRQRGHRSAPGRRRVRVPAPSPRARARRRARAPRRAVRRAPPRRRRPRLRRPRATGRRSRRPAGSVRWRPHSRRLSVRSPASVA